ncbi:DNA cytosine methyltransferase [Martelella sp. HB161492]|uniref:DNA cytosine methyltransferase n=1 Tax=Martelella sp. HB161492 TaxID=2720726 RepID=UPI001AEEC4A5|nr:DNA cytosine methyltransferase [Martelella sp. HB161492]
MAGFGGNGPLIIDSFAGGGGASTGIEMALGRSPDIAINHNPVALAMHEANHPDTLHLSENIYKVDPLDYVAGQHIGLAWFSPDCKHFSKAKGGKPVERNIRDLAHIIPAWVERIQKSGGRIDVIVMENVEEFSTWGPLIKTEKGDVPDPDRKGETFQKWCKTLRRLGGKLETRELRACDYGAPTIRKRLFVIIRFDGRPIVWPQPTHGAPDDADVYFGHRKPWRTAAEIIDWSLPCPSIFDTAEEIMDKHGLRAVRPLADNTEARIARGMQRYVIEAETPFMVNLTHGGRVESAGEPFKTLTAAHRGEKAAIVPSVMRFNTGATGSAIDEPLPTITANSFIKRPGGAAPLGIMSAFVSRQFGKSIGHGLDAPAATVTAGVNKSALITPVVTFAQHGGAVRPADAPFHTITASKKDQNAVISPLLMSLKGETRRASTVCAPHPTICAEGNHSSLITPTLIQTGYGERQGQAPRSLDFAAFVAQHNNDSRRIGGVNPGRSMALPLSTVTASGSQQGTVAAYCAKYFGTGDGARYSEPCHTVTTKDRFGHIQAALDVPPFTEAQAERARQVAAFLRKYGFWDEREFVTLEINGNTYVIVDIGMRMLTPRELFRAQGFPEDYQIDRAPDGTLFTKSAQVSAVGNSVSPPVAAAIIGANCGHLIAELFGLEAAA